jgi:hypothetical protein
VKKTTRGDAGRPTVRTASSNLFTVMNDHWMVKETTPGLFLLTSRDDDTTLGPMAGERLVGTLSVISELEQHLREER